MIDKMLPDCQSSKNLNDKAIGVLINHVIVKMNDLLLQPGGKTEDVEVHEMKSLLYAAVERTGFELNRLYTIQRLLRELFGIVSIGADLRDYERKAGLQILNDLQNKYLRSS